MSEIKHTHESTFSPKKAIPFQSKNWSNQLLISLIINKGNPSVQGNALAQVLLDKFGQKLSLMIQNGTLDQLQKVKNIGPKRALALVAAIELTRRIKIEEITPRLTIKSSKDAFDHLMPNLLYLNHEEFWILILNRANEVLQKENISVGGVSGTLVDVKKIFQIVLSYKRASAIILAHNHPSGNLMPSQADRSITKKITAAAQLLDVNILDHIIFTDNGYLSFADEGYL
jgi:DNA repair protein RadC